LEQIQFLLGHVSEFGDTNTIDEFIERVTISPLRMLRSEAVQDCGFGVFEIEQAQDGSRAAASSSGSWSVLPPCHRSMSRVVSQRVSSGLPLIPRFFQGGIDWDRACLSRV
jgi:hypothetical protein